MVIVAELVKRLIVVQEIVGSTPTFHTKASLWWNGKHNDLKRRKLLVRLQSGVQKNRMDRQMIISKELLKKSDQLW